MSEPQTWTPALFASRMREYAKMGDKEMRHSLADGLMEVVLESLGYHEGVQVFNEMDRWYA